MIHELLGTKNNTIDLNARDDVADELKQLTLSASSDEFYRHNMYANFGEIGQTIQKLVQSFQEKVIYVNIIVIHANTRKYDKVPLPPILQLCQ